MQRSLVLAFSSLEDLPTDWESYKHIDAYGQITSPELSYPANIHLHDRFFEIGKVTIPKPPYSFCFIRHPDPWGEPRSWMQAIAALGECLQGRLQCEFWHPHEIIAFHFLLTQVLSSDQVHFESAIQIADVGEWANFSVSWTINPITLQKDMLEQYQKEKQQILQQFFNTIGQYYQETSLQEAITKIQSKQ